MTAVLTKRLKHVLYLSFECSQELLMKGQRLGPQIEAWFRGTDPWNEIEMFANYKSGNVAKQSLLWFCLIMASSGALFIPRVWPVCQPLCERSLLAPSGHWLSIAASL